MTTATISKPSPLDLESIQKLVHQGKSVVSSEDSEMVKWAIKRIKGGEKMTLYLKPTVFDAIERWYWTPERMQLVGLEPLTPQLKKKIKNDFGIKIDGYANSLECPRCSAQYSTYEFIEQGIEQHGGDIVRQTFSLKRAAVFQINPVQDIICRSCSLRLIRAARPGSIRVTYHYNYSCVERNAYACCESSILGPIIAATVPAASK